jgi:branched-chain amino acid aminotransferase
MGMDQTIRGSRADDDIARALSQFTLPEKLGFGIVDAPVMFQAVFAGGVWSEGELVPYGTIDIWPNARALQFAEQIFEGMKAYRVNGGSGNFFRPRDNAARFVRSALRLGMPAVPEALFMRGIGAVAATCRPFIPGHSGSALYLRPCMFGTQAQYTVRNSDSALFMVLGSPSESYSSGAMRVRIERGDVRAARGGIGTAKAGANYAASLRATSGAIEAGYAMTLWLDPDRRSSVEELSGMNVFAVIDGALHTPKLSDSILAGITRDSVILLARRLGIEVIEQVMPIDDLLVDVGSGRCSELFACGTAAIISPISELGEADGPDYRPAVVDGMAAMLRDALLAIQEGRAPDPFGWIEAIPDEAA